jgi:hypothetical protein
MKFDIAELRETKALFSEDRKFRYALWREWNAPENDLALFINEAAESRVANKGFANFICLNPSTADETADDPTIAKCIRFSKQWGYSGFCMTNLFAFRATDPEDMKYENDPIGVANDHHVLEIAKIASMVICAWGNDGTHLNRAAQVFKNLRNNNVSLHYLKRNGEGKGEPAHPLYLSEKTTIPHLF